ncbi:MAG: hypothetical protein JW751_28875 [Polyangiaceae bacterium]|nr:hypothetical protein [Polyangiaceae bacterium]
MAMQMRSWQLGCIVIGLLVSASVGCKKDDDDNPNGGDAGAGTEGGSTSTGGRTTGGEDNGGEPTTTGGRATGGRLPTEGGEGGVLVGGAPSTGGRVVVVGGEGGEPATTGGRTGGTGGGGTGGVATTGGAGTGGDVSTGGTAGDNPGGAGTGGIEPTGEIEDVITAICNWEFRCCDTGELNYRMSPFITGPQDCVDTFTYELRQSNGTNNPYLSGSATGLLGTLAYAVDLSRVSVNAENVAACAALQDDMACYAWMEPDPDPHCVAASGEMENPCALDQLFSPALALGDRCTLALTEGATNDIECPVGSTCLPGGHEDNPNTYPSCVSRGLEGQPCTLDGDCDFNHYCFQGDCALKGEEGDDCSFNDPAHPAPGDEDMKCQGGLSCHPVDLVCVAVCTEDFICASDAACPDGFGCAPIEVDNSTSLFSACLPLGTSPAALCNTDGDCAASMHCDGARCQNDFASGADCTAHNECAAGQHCDLSGTSTCINNIAAGDSCTNLYDPADQECGPNSKGCLNVGDTDDDGAFDYVCRSSLLSNGTRCGEDAACLSGLCELASESATYMVCIAGAGLNADCDSNVEDGEAQRCGPAYLCFEGECIAKAGPGESCIDPTDEANPALCASGSSCDTAWQGEPEMCTDAAVSRQDGGSGVVCDGAD